MEKDKSDENKLDKAHEEGIAVAGEIFEESWKKIKKESEGTSKKEACRYSFILGFMSYMKILDEKSREFHDAIKDNPEKFEKAMKSFKEGFGGEI